MMKFILVSRRPDGGSYERMMYEWSVIHVVLMLTTPTVTRVFKRYAQHYGLWDVPDSHLLYPRSPERWETMADHWLDTYDDLVLSVTAPDFVERMGPHRFTSDQFVIMLGTSGRTIFEREDFRSGGVKLIHWHKRRDGMSRGDFERRFAVERGPALADALKPHGLRRYEQTVPIDIDPAVFKGTPFELGSVGAYAGLEEIWLDSSDRLVDIQADAAAMKAIRDSGDALFASGQSFSMVMLERLAFDFVTRERHRMAAVQDPGSLEAQLFGQEKVYQEAIKRLKPPSGAGAGGAKPTHSLPIFASD